MAKPKKYAHVVGDLPQIPLVAPERRALVDAVREEIRSPLTESPVNLSACLTAGEQVAKDLVKAVKQLKSENAANLAHGYATARLLRERIDAWSSEMGIVVEAYQWMMVEAMNAGGLQAITLSTGQPISIWQEPNAKVEDKEAFRRWCDADPDLRLKLALPYQTMNMLIKEMLLSGAVAIDEETGQITPAPMPPGISVGAVTKVRLGSE